VNGDNDYLLIPSRARGKPSVHFSRMKNLLKRRFEKIARETRVRSVSLRICVRICMEMRSSILIAESKGLDNGTGQRMPRLSTFRHFVPLTLEWRVIVVGRANRHRNGIMTQLMGRFVPEGCPRGWNPISPRPQPPHPTPCPVSSGDVRRCATYVADTREPQFRDP